MSDSADAANSCIRFVFGDIANQKADAIVCSIMEDKQMRNCELARYLKKKTGASVQDILDQIPDELSFGQVVSTSAGDLGDHVKSIMFACMKFWEHGYDEVLKSIIFDCLDEASINKYTSIAFPTLGMGGFRYPERMVAIAFYKAVAEFFCMNPDTSLKSVYIVLPVYIRSQQASIETFLEFFDTIMEVHNFADPDKSKHVRMSMNGVERKSVPPRGTGSSFLSKLFGVLLYTVAPSLGVAANAGHTLFTFSPIPGLQGRVAASGDLRSLSVNLNGNIEIHVIDICRSLGRRIIG